MRLIKNISLVGLGSAIAQVIFVVGTPILTRLYDPEKFAEWAIFMSIAAFLLWCCQLMGTLQHQSGWMV